MKKLLFILVSVFVIIGCSEPSLENASVALNSKPALWKATKNHKTIYLLGSVHILPPEIKWYSPKIQNAYNSSDVLVVETLDIKDQDKSRLLQSKYGLLPNGKVISDYLTKEEYQKYIFITNEIGIDQYYANRLKPWLFFVILQNIATKDMAKYGVDILFINNSKKIGKPILTLESNSEALSSISSIPLSKDIKRLKKLLNRQNITKEEVQDRVDTLLAWTRGDIDRLDYLLKKHMNKSDYNNIISKRNKMWYPRPYKFNKRYNTIFAVVGTAHLVGRYSLLSYLKSLGYKITRIQ